MRVKSNSSHEGEGREPKPSARPHRQRLGDVLLARGVITPDQLTKALEAQRINGLRLGESLRAMGISSEAIVTALSEQLQIPRAQLSPGTLDPMALQIIPEHLARRLQAIPVKVTDTAITVAMVDPLDVTAIDDIQLLSGRKVHAAVITPEEFYMGINQYPTLDNSVEAAVKDFVTPVSEDEELTPDNLTRVAEEAPVVRLVSLILSRAVHQRASDIHIEPQRQRVRVRYRIDGLLTQVITLPRSVQAGVISRIKILSNMDIAEHRLPQDGRMALRIDGKELDIRISTVPSVHGENVVMRLLHQEDTRLVLDKLGLSTHDSTRLAAAVRRSHGIFLLTGPTGSGKTTTLYTILQMLNSPDRNIVTIEDPVEYNIEGITQVPVNPKTGLTFASGLRSFLRQDPNIIMVGEIRDTETGRLAIQAALTGHLVLSTLHTNTAPGAVTRLGDMGIEPYQISATLLAVAAQRLVRVLCSKCKAPAELAPDVAVRLGLSDAGEPLRVYKPQGCPACSDTGYQGRVAVFELMDVDERIRGLIAQSPPEHEIRAAAVQGGMRPLQDDGLQKVLAGVTSVEELIRVLGMS